MTATQPLLDRDRVRELFDLRGPMHAYLGGHYEADPYPTWNALMAQGPVHEGTLHGLTGLTGDLFFHGLPEPDRKHFTVFGYDACAEAFKDAETFASAVEPVDFSKPPTLLNSMLSMDGDRHRRYRMLVQPRFVPAQVRWWTEKSIAEVVRLLVDTVAPAGRAELNVDFCAAIPVLTITSAFGIPVEQALDVRAAVGDADATLAIIAPLVTARREDPRDDLISVLAQAELKLEDGTRTRLSDVEIYSFCMLLLAAGSGTTWKQMGITLTALLQRPALLAQVQADRSLLPKVIEESLRWEPTDPMFSRWVTRDVDFHGTRLPAGSVVHLCLGSANRDPAHFPDPDAFDPFREQTSPLMSFAVGPHSCLGMHVARAEMRVGIGALLDRLPGLRLDPDQPAPEITGFYERGASEIHVLFDGSSEGSAA